MIKKATPSFLALLMLSGAALANLKTNGLISIDTGRTITKVRTAVDKSGSYMVASSYEGSVLSATYNKGVTWENKLSGYMNHDLWCDDVTDDGIDEIFAANADGNLYCLDKDGELLWQFKANDAPMYAVCVVHHKGTSYVVCGGMDMNVYYLSPAGKLIKTLPSSDYSIAKTWGVDASPSGTHYTNFLRVIQQPDGTEVLAVHGSMNHMQDSGVIYQFEPLADTPFRTTKIKMPTPVGELRVCNRSNSDQQEIVMGTSGVHQNTQLVRFNPSTEKMDAFVFKNLGFGYRVAQSETIFDGKENRYFALVGEYIFLVPTDLNPRDAEQLTCRFSFNDMWKDTDSGHIILASSQSGGSCIHVIDPANPKWKESYEQLTPPGKISTILENTAAARAELKKFKRPTWEREPLPVYLMTESASGVQDIIDELTAKYSSPLFLGNVNCDKEDWDRSGIESKKYRERRDRRMRYTLNQEQVLNKIIPAFNNNPGIAYWAGHGNDPYMYQPDTTKKVIDAAKGKKTVLIYPEATDDSPEFKSVMDDLFIPLAQHAQGRNANIFFRTKHLYWQGGIYLPMWQRFVSGEFADVFVPAMEETTDKCMELSVAARTGFWASGAVNAWGARCARDNASFDRSRQFSNQELPNNFLRNMVYNLSSGAQYINNFSVDQNYMSFLWELIAKGALYVPKREEIVSFSPVHLSIVEPDPEYIERSSNTKWSTFFDQDFENNNRFVFGRTNGSWPGAPTTEWDFSRYAAGVTDRRLNFIPPYQNGLVLITPPQHGRMADSTAPRGQLTDHLHPLYKNIMKEYYTNGRDYLARGGEKTFPAETYYRRIETDIQAGANQLPLTVSGDVAWVCAQTDPKHLRLTLVDSGYINPDIRTATVTFHTVQPVKISDVLNNNTIPITDPESVTIDVPCGLFRFIDIELTEAL